MVRIRGGDEPRDRGVARSGVLLDRLGFGTPIRRRKAFANATSLGLSVDELTPRDAKASQELSAMGPGIAGHLRSRAQHGE